MKPEYWQQVEHLYRAVLGRDDSQRHAFLEQACAGNEVLRRDVESRLAGNCAEPDLAGTSTAAAKPESFRGTERLEVRRKLGSGGFGVVYEAYDREHNAFLALKVLNRMGADALYRFKREFRALADISHPNLVTLYELAAHGNQWFFTMELVGGVDFLSYVRQDARQPESLEKPSELTTLPLSSDRTIQKADQEPEAANPSALPAPDMDRLREAFRQLAEGVCALHGANKLHCDLKPSNVLVDSSGRVVVLDFGLVAESDGVDIEGENSVAGTPEYISPEQVRRLPPSPASDWYSVGVMLFEALTGRRPFRGSTSAILREKCARESAAPLELVPGLPQELNDLCCRLLSRDPVLRPGAAEILRCLGSDIRVDGEPPASLRSISRSPFIGRRRHLAVLRQAFESTLAGRHVTVWLHGGSGVGKTALVRQFLEDARRKGDLVILDGRCYEREAVPYKALDSVVDRLGRYLMRLPRDEARTLMPLDLSALVRLFPVLQEWRALRGADVEPADILDLQELRRRGFAAFRRVLEGIATRLPVVLFIDDLQWGDADSVALLADLVSSGGEGALLFIGCYRGEEAGSSPLLRRLLPVRPTGEAGESTVVDLELQELDPAEAAELAVVLLKEGEATPVSQAESIALEAAGNPFFINELVRYAQVCGAGTQASVRRASVSDVIRARSSHLSDGARQLLEVVAVAGRPVDLRIARRAAQISGGGYAELSQLRAARLVRTLSADGPEEVETYHDRIREVTESSLDLEVLKQHHYHLAVASESSPRADPRFLAVHFRRAGIMDKAFHYSVEAADQAAKALAFGGAAEWYRFALELGPAERAAAQDLRVKLGDALSNAGKGPESAEAYLAAAESVRGVESLELRRRAAAQLMMSGRTDEGLALIRRVLTAFGMKPQTTLRSVLMFFLRRSFIRLRGLNFRERLPDEIAPWDLLRVDMCWSLIQGLGMVDPIQAHQFLPRQLLFALRCGDPYRVSLAVSTEASYLSLSGGRLKLRAQKLLQVAQVLAHKSRHPHAIGVAALVTGLSAFLRGEWKDAARLMDHAASILREQCTGVAWEMATAHMMGSVSLFLMGDLKELSRRLPQILKEAEARGDLYEITDLRTRLSHTLHLAADEPASAHRELDSVLDRWRRKDFDLQHWWALIGRIEIDLYSGRSDVAWKRVTEQWPALRWSFLMRVQYVCLESLHHRARAALALACDQSMDEAERRKLLRMAARDAARMKSHRMPWGDALANLTQAGVAGARGDRAGAMSLLSAAEAGFEAADMALYAAAARRRRGQLTGGQEGRSLVDVVDVWMAGQNIRNPERMTAMLAPGDWNRGSEAAPRSGPENSLINR